MPSRPRDSGDAALPLYEVSTDRLRLTFLPTVGGRLLSLRIDDDELLWRNPAFFDADLRVVRPRATWSVVDGTFASWSNVGGSKSWPAPQGWGGEGEWAGPPDAVLDAGAWEWDEADEGDRIVITMTSADDPRTGLRLQRRFEIPSTGTRFAQTISMTNIGDRDVTWAPWEVCQVATAAGAGGSDAAVVVGVDGTAAPLEQGDWVGRLEWHRTDRRIELPVQEVVGKRGFPDATGSVAWRGPEGLGLELRFDPVEGARYPDGGARVEVWMQAPAEPIADLSGLHPTDHLAELEVLGPLADLPPGASTSLEVEWVLTAGR